MRFKNKNPLKLLSDFAGSWIWVKFGASNPPFGSSGSSCPRGSRLTVDLSPFFFLLQFFIYALHLKFMVKNLFLFLSFFIEINYLPIFIRCGIQNYAVHESYGKTRPLHTKTLNKLLYFCSLKKGKWLDILTMHPSLAPKLDWACLQILLLPSMPLQM